MPLGALRPHLASRSYATGYFVDLIGKHFERYSKGCYSSSQWMYGRRSACEKLQSSYRCIWIDKPCCRFILIRVGEQRDSSLRS